MENDLTNSEGMVDRWGRYSFSLPIQYRASERWCVAIQQDRVASVAQGAWLMDAHQVSSGRGRIDARGNIVIEHKA